jgi:hypothetical protein
MYLETMEERIAHVIKEATTGYELFEGIAIEYLKPNENVMLDRDYLASIRNFVREQLADQGEIACFDITDIELLRIIIEYAVSAGECAGIVTVDINIEFMYAVEESIYELSFLMNEDYVRFQGIKY